MTPKQIRHALHLTQAEAANSLGISVTTWSRWETKTFKPSRIALRLLAQLEAKIEKKEGE
jgi:DNA-binding transcriptional regulator YiaG